MSTAVMRWVWQHSRSQNAARLVLLAIADACNSDDGTGAWPSIAALMAKTNLSERAVRQAIGKVVTLGELKVEQGGGRGSTNQYTVVMNVVDNPADPAPFTEPNPADPAPFKSRKGADPAGKGADFAPGTIKNLKPSTTKGGKGVRGKTAKRGTRIPEDFASHVTAEMVTWARERCPNVDGRLATEAFVAYWLGESGARATKLDWTQAWKNWLLRDQSRASPRARPTAPPSNAPKPIPKTAACPRPGHEYEPAANCQLCASETKGARR